MFDFFFFDPNKRFDENMKWVEDLEDALYNLINEKKEIEKNE